PPCGSGDRPRQTGHFPDSAWSPGQCGPEWRVFGPPWRLHPGSSPLSGPAYRRRTSGPGRRSAAPGPSLCHGTSRSSGHRGCGRSRSSSPPSPEPAVRTGCPARYPAGPPSVRRIPPGGVAPAPGIPPDRLAGRCPRRGGSPCGCGRRRRRSGPLPHTRPQPSPPGFPSRRRERSGCGRSSIPVSDSLHPLLLHLVVDDMALLQLRRHVLQGDAHLDHQHHHMVGQVGDLIDGLLPVLLAAADDDLGALLTHLLQDLVQALFKKISGVAALLGIGLPPLDQAVQ
ncbi:Fructose-bisphosphate aldolase, partial [Dysosmobacter welbionis]